MAPTSRVDDETDNAVERRQAYINGALAQQQDA
jgi:hypothetical protein